MADVAPTGAHPPDPTPAEQPAAKPQRASGYTPDMLELVRRTCLYVATVLGDLLEESVTVVVGLVPYLLVPQDAITGPGERHIGTRDLDLGLSLGVLDDERYEVIAERLRRAGFHPDRNGNRNLTRQRWRIDAAAGLSVAVDFLIPPVPGGPDAGKPFPLEPDLAATITTGLELAFRDRVAVELDGRTIRDEWARRTVWVCGPGAFVILKALAFRIRGERKDAYDLFYVVRNYGAGVQDVAHRLRPLPAAAGARRARGGWREDFSRPAAGGPRRVAAFLEPVDEDALRADARAFVLDLLARCAADVAGDAGP